MSFAARTAPAAPRSAGRRRAARASVVAAAATVVEALENRRLLSGLTEGAASVSADDARSSDAAPLERKAIAPAAANVAPTVSLAVASTSTVAPATITLQATAADADGTLRRVEFYRGATKLGRDTTAPYTFTITNVAVGTYTFTATAIDNAGAAGTSAPVTVTVTKKVALPNQAPVVTLANTSSSTVAPATVKLLATATDSDGTIARVDFYRGTTKLGQDTTAPYTFNINNVGVGTYTYTAKAIDNKSLVGTSAPLNVTITKLPPANQLPVVTLSNNATSTVAPATVALRAQAVDLDGSVARVEFYAGGVLLGEDTTAPYDYPVTNVAAGTYSYTAKAYDNLGAAGTSAELPVTITPPAAVNAPPTVALKNPLSGTYAGPGYFAVRADAADSDGTISRVDFLANGQLIKSTDAAPWLVSWREVPVGTYTVQAVAYDDKGASTASASSLVSIATPEPGATYHVAPTGDDAFNPGSAAQPFRTITRAAEAAQAGDTVLIAAGTYTESVVVPRGGAAARPIKFEAQGTVVVEAPVIDPLLGTRAANLFIPASDAVDHVWVTGITFRNAGNASGGDKSAVRTQDGWRVVDCTIELVAGSAIGIFGDRVLVQGVIAQDNGVSGITSTSTDETLILDSTTRRNNTRINTSDGGGGKITRAEGLLVEGLHAYANNGPGFWFDINNINSVVRDSAFHDNVTATRLSDGKKVDGRGLFFEISGLKVNTDTNVYTGVSGPLLAENNLAYDNTFAGITVYATSYAHLRGNTLANNKLELKDGGRQPWMTQFATIQGNFFKNARLLADSGSISNWAARGYAFNGNTFDNTDSRVYTWGGTDYSLAQVQSVLGFELTGKYATVTFVPWGV
jgi:parallel beta-helix repeat protein